MANEEQDNTHMSEQTTATFQQTNLRSRINIQQAQDILIVWLNTCIDTTSQDYQIAIAQLQNIVDEVYTFTDNDQCIDFILSNGDQTKICLIISGLLGPHLVPCIHEIPHIDSILPFCDNPNGHEQWAKTRFKVKGIFTEMTHICDYIKHIIRRYELNIIPMSFVAYGKRLDRLDPSFMYTQIIKEILLTIRFEDKHIKEFVDYYCNKFAENEIDRKKVKQLEYEYHKHTPIWWYTSEGFPYSVLNRALRLVGGEVITLMGFFIKDLHRHIEELHREQFLDTSIAACLTVYRGQYLATKDFDELVASRGGLMSFNNFLSTSQNRHAYLLFTPTNRINRSVVSVLFVMTADSKQLTTPFASVRHVSQYPEEEEVLFSMHSIFRINGIKPMVENEEMYEVELSLTNDNDEELCALTDQIRKESIPDAEGWMRLSIMLSSIAQSDMAERICRNLMNENMYEADAKDIYNQLGSIKYQQGQYEEATKLYKKSLELRMKSLPSNHPDVASSYNNIGLVYSAMGDYPKALSSYEQVRNIQMQSLPLNHPDLAISYNNIGNVYSDTNDYAKALSFHEQALKIRQESLSSNHPHVASSYNNIGNAYFDMRDYPKALASQEQALKIRMQSLPPNHPDIASSYNNIGNIHFAMNDYPKALASYEQALKIRQQSLSSNHPDVALSYNNIGNVYLQMNDYSSASMFYNHALSIGQQCLPLTHPHLQLYKTNVEAVQNKF
ncbi:unnamed protein product [Adineta ricciae]|uniref:ADP ribosyltransferase domain-containing protein n=1 Tax=Adineta ricciae TaxID=249248 RepID=A0A815Y6H4_ADIRI|nr:unnamed protein product [Adineta ricciae]